MTASTMTRGELLRQARLLGIQAAFVTGEFRLARTEPLLPLGELPAADFLLPGQCRQFFLPGLMTSGETGIFVFVILAMALMGMTYGLIGTALAAPFPTKVRYTGSSITFNFAGIFGASLAPYIATWLQATYGMTYVGYYLGLSAVITLACILLSGKEEV